MPNEMPPRIWLDSTSESRPYVTQGPLTERPEYTEYVRADALNEARDEMRRYLPIIEAAERDPALWWRLTAGTGIATANGYRNALAKIGG